MHIFEDFEQKRGATHNGITPLLINYEEVFLLDS